MSEYSDLYVLYCSELNDGVTKEEVRKHNTAMGQLERLLHFVEMEPDKSFLLELLHYQNDRVKLTVSAHCLRLNEYVEEATKTLLELTNSRYDGDVAFNAKVILKLRAKDERGQGDG